MPETIMQNYSEPVQGAFLYQQLAGHYAAAIRARVLRAGERLPSIRAVMQQHAVSLSTAQMAMHELERQGWVQARPRAGFYVAARAEDALPATAAPLLQVDLSTALPHAGLWPQDVLRRLAGAVLRQWPRRCGQAPACGGSMALRTVLARRLVEGGARVSGAGVLACADPAQALLLVLRAAAWSGQVVLLDPARADLAPAISAIGLSPRPMPESCSGLAALASRERVAALVLAPSSSAEVAGWLQACRKAHLTLVVDASAAPLASEALPLLDEAGDLAWIGSLAALIGPGPGVAWTVPGRLLPQVRQLAAALGSHVEPVADAVAADYLASPAWRRQQQRAETLLAACQQQARALIGQHLPWLTVLPMAAGQSRIWLRLPQGMAGTVWLAQARAAGVQLYDALDWPQPQLGLNCAAVTAPVLAGALARLAHCAGGPA